MTTETSDANPLTFVTKADYPLTEDSSAAVVLSL
jgi:hypothetical protein